MEGGVLGLARRCCWSLLTSAFSILRSGSTASGDVENQKGLWDKAGISSTWTSLDQQLSEELSQGAPGVHWVGSAGFRT